MTVVKWIQIQIEIHILEDLYSFPTDSNFTLSTLFRIIYKKVKKNYTLNMIANDLEEEVEVIRPIYERAKREIRAIE